MTDDTPRPTFADLTRLEPRLRDLASSARALARVEARKWKYACGNRVFYAAVKPRLVYLVGFLRADKHPVLGSRDAYDVAYEHLYHLMPDCKECSCW